ncbi:methyl-accepting chemotaxis protein [Natronolimnobius sp. AArcel1]|uniref:methyl-accepting chemotaxis protein n=1 Tax=Natronolimnobius sp. AArcel1 TaxID=1679093 RepID=UPI0013EB5883|nr:methyl-accepting chemotaxis protein [Natronolimnobius sp. AArcel1]NGM71134.1 methyl-accepting chemotaxis protein [Natronolimnobius sp. AArcel1]
MGLSIGAIGFIATAEITESVEGSALEEQEDTAVREAAAFDEWDEQNENFLVTASNSPVIHSDDDEAIESYLQEIYYDFPEERMNVLFVDTASEEVIAGVDSNAASVSDNNFPDGDELDDLSIHTVQRTGPYEMPDELGIADDDSPVVSYYIGIEDADRALIFTVSLSDRVGDHTTQTRSDTVVTMLDEQGRIVSDDAQLGFVDNEDMNSSFLRSYDGYEEYAEIADLEGPGAMTVDGQPSESLHDEPYEFAPENYVVGYHTTDDDWTVLVHTSEANALGFVNTVNQFGYLLTAIGVGLIGVLGVVIGRNTATSIRTLSREAEQIKDGNYDVTLESAREDELGDLYRTVDEMRASLVTQLEESEQTRKQAERAREEADEARQEAEQAQQQAEQAQRNAQEQNDHLERTAAQYCDVMQVCADGDLTRRLEPDTENEAMADIATTFNAMLDDIEQTVASISTFADDVSDASDDVRTECVDLEASSDDVAGSVQEITTVAGQQNDRMQTIAAEIQGMSATIEEIASTADTLASTSQQAAKQAGDGMDAAEDVVEEMEVIEHRANGALSELRDLEAAMAEIDEIAGVITDIADQTNILALNASIEAAHASNGGNGDNSGAGFATVAQEVKGLAEETKTSAEEIEELIATVQDQTDTTVTEMEGMRSRVIEGAETVEESAAAFEEIESGVREADHGVQEINDATDDIADATQELVSMADDVTELSKATASEADTVADAVTDQTAAITTVSRNASDLSEQSVELQELLEEFEVDDATADGRDGDGIRTDPDRDDQASRDDDTPGDRTPVVHDSQ